MLVSKGMIMSNSVQVEAYRRSIGHNLNQQMGELLVDCWLSGLTEGFGWF